MKTTPCISCARFTFRGCADSKSGRGRCLALPADVSLHIEKSTLCRNFQHLPPDQSEARRVWWMSNKPK